MNKKGELSFEYIGKLLIILALLLVVVVTFFGDGLYSSVSDMLADQLHIPERDPHRWETSWQRQNEFAIDVYNDLLKGVDLAANAKNNPCIAPYLGPDEGFFDENYKILIRKETGSMNTQLFQYVVDDSVGTTSDTQIEQNNAVTSKRTITGLQPCIVSKDKAINVFRDFNEKGSPSLGKYGIPVESIYLTNEEELVVKGTGFPAEGKVLDLDYGDRNKPNYYLIRDGDLICFIPTETDTIFNPFTYGCSERTNDYYDQDCFDKGDDKTIPTILENDFDKKYLCKR